MFEKQCYITSHCMFFSLTLIEHCTQISCYDSDILFVCSAFFKGGFLTQLIFFFRFFFHRIFCRKDLCIKFNRSDLNRYCVSVRPRQGKWTRNMFQLIPFLIPLTQWIDIFYFSWCLISALYLSLYYLFCPIFVCPE